MKKWTIGGLGLLLLGANVLAEEIVVELKPEQGVLTATGLEPGSTCTVEWASTLSAGFTNTSPDFEGVLVDSNGIAQVAVPMFFRVRGTPAPPEGMVEISAGTNSGIDPDYGDYSLTNESAFYMDQYEVTNDKMVEVMQWAYDNGKLTMSSSSAKNASGNAQELLDLDSIDCRITWDGLSFSMKSTKGSGYPCVEVTWYGSVAYCNYRSEMEGRTPCYDLSDWSCDFNVNGHRLPTSDEWEYAARGGLSGKRFPWGDTINHDHANYRANGSAYSYDTSPYTDHTYHPDYDDGGSPYTSPAGTFAPNGYELYDMTGNVWEWCNTASEASRHFRGGSWYGSANSACCGNES